RMEISDVGHGTVHPDRISFSVPFGLVRHGLRAAGGRVRQELECRFDQSIEAEQVRSLWKELSEKPDGTEVTRTFDEDRWGFVKDGASIRITVGRPRSEEGTDDTATITIPAAFLSRLADRDKPLDVDALLGELTASQAGNLLEIASRDGRVKVWID
ncbi:MAG TPA: hypothetical protein VF580_01295, partial [Thermoanaerobaculia bacterium]